MQSGLFIFFFGVIPGVFSVICKPSNIEFRNKKKNYIRRIPYIIEIDVDRCPELTILYYKWTLINSGDPRNNMIEGYLYRDYFLDGYRQVPGDAAFTSKTTLTVTVSHYENFSIYSEGTLDIEFAPEPFHLEIVGGEKRIHPDDQILVLDGLSFSYDPSYSRNEPDLFDSYDIEWTSVPPIHQSLLSTKNPKIQPKFLKKNVAYNFTMTVIRDKNQTLKGFYYKASVSQIVTLKKYPAHPGLEIICVYNCPHSNYREAVVLEINCLYNCETSPKKWFWSLNPDIPQSKKQLGNGHNRLIIDGYSYRPGTKVTVTANDGLYFEYKILSYSPTITPGNCFVEPKEGLSAVTLFKVTCEGFRSQLGIRKYTVYQTYGLENPGIILHYGERLDEKEIFLSPGNPAVVLVWIEDESFMRASKRIVVTVRSPEVRLTDLKVIVFGRTSYSLYTYWQKNKRSEMIQTVSFVVEALQNTPGVSEQERRNLYIRLMRYVSFLEPRDYGSVLQWTSVIHKIQLYYNNTLDTFTTRYIAQTLEGSLNILHYIILHNLEETPILDVHIFLQNIFEVLTFLMQPMDEIKNHLNVHLAPHDYDTYEDMVHQHLEIRDNLRELTECCFRSFELIHDITMHLAFLEENEKSYYTTLSGFIARKILPENMPPYLTIRRISNSRVHFSDKLINFLVKTYSSISYCFIIFSYDPFWWHSNITELSTNKFLCAIYHENEKITVVPAPFYVTLAMKKNPALKIQGNVTDATPFNIAVHRIIVNPKAQLLAFFEAPTQSFQARFSDCYCSPEDMKNAKLITADSFERHRGIYYQTKLDVAFLCVQRLDLSNDLNYIGWINKFECMYWDLERGNFEADLIKVSEYHLPQDDNLVCESFHFSFFLGREITPVHYLNTPVVSDFYIAFTRNVNVIIFVVVLLCIWLILLYWAIFKDREFAKKNVICKLDDNVPGDQHIYLVVVFTGVYFDAGTTADVAIQLVGDRSDSRVHLIKCRKKTLLKRNSQDWLIIYTPDFLGTIKIIRLWHNCEGSEPHWYCQRIIVEHLESGSQYFFLVEEWLSLIWGSGKIYHEIQVKHRAEMKDWQMLFAIKMENLKEDHLWLSVVVRQSPSSFNCKERVSTAIAAIFLSMLACAILLGFPQGVPSDSIDPQNTYFITRETIVIFTESWLISIPVIFLIILIFKNSAP